MLYTSTPRRGARKRARATAGEEVRVCRSRKTPHATPTHKNSQTRVRALPAPHDHPALPTHTARLLITALPGTLLRTLPEHPPGHPPDHPPEHPALTLLPAAALADSWDLESLKADLEEYEGPHAARPHSLSAPPAPLAMSNSQRALLGLPPAAHSADTPPSPAPLLSAHSNDSMSALPPPSPHALHAAKSHGHLPLESHDKARHESVSIAQPSELELRASALLSLNSRATGAHDTFSSSRHLMSQTSRQKSRQRPGERAPLRWPPPRGRTTGQIHV